MSEIVRLKTVYDVFAAHGIPANFRGNRPDVTAYKWIDEVDRILTEAKRLGWIGRVTHVGVWSPNDLAVYFEPPLPEHPEIKRSIVKGVTVVTVLS